MVDRHYTDADPDPAEIYRNGENEVPDELFTRQVIVSSDPRSMSSGSRRSRSSAPTRWC